MLAAPLLIVGSIAGMTVLIIAGSIIKNARPNMITPDPRSLNPVTSSPWRIGNTVLISEDLSRPELDWYATVISTKGDTLQVRDNAAPYAVATVDKADAYRWDAMLDRTDAGWRPTEWKRWEL